MRREGGAGKRPVWTRFEAMCAWCGRVPVEVDELDVYVGSDGVHALFEFECPECRRLNVRPLDLSDVGTLRSLGIEPSIGPAPFELLEDHAGPAIDWDDIIDLHMALAQRGASSSGRISEAA